VFGVDEQVIVTAAGGRVGGGAAAGVCACAKAFADAAERLTEAHSR
jgi:hypothetical protein